MSVCVYVHVCVYACMGVHVCVCVYMCVYVCTYVCMRVCVCVHACLYDSVYVCVRAYACVSVHARYVCVCMFGSAAHLGLLVQALPDNMPNVSAVEPWPLLVLEVGSLVFLTHILMSG
jgi:hypothetical protein